MGRKKKYATPEEALKAQYKRRTKTFIFSEKLNLIKESVESAPELLEKIFDRSKDTYDWCEFDPSDVYLYAIIGVDATIDALYRTITVSPSRGETTFKKNNGSKGFEYQTNRLVMLANQLRFRSWLYDKLELSAKLSKELTEDEMPGSRTTLVADQRVKGYWHWRTPEEKARDEELKKAKKKRGRPKQNQTNQPKEELNDADTTAFTESDTKQEGTL